VTVGREPSTGPDVGASDGRAPAGRRHRAGGRRRLGWALIAYGVFGLVLVVGGAVLVLGSLSVVDGAATAFEETRAEVVAVLGPASDSISSAATSAGNAGGSLGEASASARSAAQLTTRLADGFDSLAELGTFSVLGAQPFESVAVQFAVAASDARAVSQNLTDMADSMTTNVADSQAVAADLERLAEQLDTLESGLATTSTTSLASLGIAVDAARLVLVGLLLWLAVPAAASIWVGARLVQAGRG
jgi:hypothetical protein